MINSQKPMMVGDGWKMPSREEVENCNNRFGLGVDDCIRLRHASERLWNMDSICCYGYYFSQKQIRDLMLYRIKPEYYPRAAKCLPFRRGHKDSYWLAATIFMFLVYDDVLKQHMTSEQLKEENFQYVLYSFLSNVTMEYRRQIVKSQFRFTFSEKEPDRELDECMRNHSVFREKEKNGNFSLVPNRILHMDLKGGEILVYLYLLTCENRTTFTCYPSFEAIGKAVYMSKNTVMKYVRGLEAKGLIETEPTTVKTKNGETHNGTLLYRILSFEQAERNYDERQMKELLAESARANAQKALEEYDKKHVKTKPEKKTEEVKKASEKPPKSAETEEELPF